MPKAELRLQVRWK